MPIALIDGIRMHYIDRGRGPVMLFVHGFPLDHSMWHWQIQDFAKDFRVLVPDLRGFGRSDATDGSISMEQFADDLVGLLDSLEIKDPVVFCGLSMGGYVGWQFVRKYRNRVRALVACDTRAIADTAEAAAGRMKTIEQVQAKGAVVVADAMLPKLFGPTSFKIRPEPIESTRQVIENTSVEGIAAALRGMASRPDVTAMLPKIACPTLVICGEEDVISPPEEMRGIADAIRKAQFVLIPEAGHMAPLECPELVNDAIREFLASC